MSKFVSCALARNLRSANNFVLQAATRCLRQVPGNNLSARIYLSMENRSILDRQLQETYGETIFDLENRGKESRSAVLKLLKIKIPPLVIAKLVRTVVPVNTGKVSKLILEKPKGVRPSSLIRSVFTIMEQQATEKLLQQIGENLSIDVAKINIDKYTAATRLADAYRLDVMQVYDELARVFVPGCRHTSYLYGFPRQANRGTNERIRSQRRKS